MLVGDTLEGSVVDAELTELMREMAETSGACLTGVATVETLKGGPPSTDLSYVLEGAKSALCFAVAMDESLIEPFLGKKDRIGFEKNNLHVNTQASGIAYEISNLLNQIGHTAVPVAANAVYRSDDRSTPLDEHAPISHRYLAVRSGLGHFGFSGNVITKEHGAAVLFASVVTTAELVPTDPLPPEDKYCNECKLCLESCCSGLMSEEETTTVTLGGVEFSYAKRRHHNRCDYVCGGFTGLHKSGKWSTWSAGRFPIPENDDEFQGAIMNTLMPYLQRPREGVGFFHPLIPGNKLEFTCAHCQLMCHPDKEVRARRFKALVRGGVVVLNPDGSREAVSPEEAERRMEAMPPEVRALYEEVPAPVETTS